MSDVPPKSANAFRTIGEVAEELGVAQHVLRFWETRFPQVQPLKRGGNRRYYRPADVELLRDIHRRLHAEGYTIKGVQKLLAERGRGVPKPAAELPAISGEGTPVPDAAPDMAPPVDLGAIRQVRDRLAAALAAARAA